MRLYVIEFNAVAVSATQDLINITSTAGMAFKLHEVQFGQKTLTSWEAKEVTIKRASGSFTAGSGGSTPTPNKVNFGDAAATVTAHANDTTAIVAGSGVLTVLYARDWEFLNGFFWMPAPEQRPIFAPSQACAINLGTAPSGSMTVSGYALIEELF